MEKNTSEPDVIEVKLTHRAARCLLSILSDRALENSQILRGDESLLQLMTIDFDRSMSLVDEQRFIGVLRSTLERKMTKCTFR